MIDIGTLSKTIVSCHFNLHYKFIMQEATNAGQKEIEEQVKSLKEELAKIK